ncbi:MAG: glycosyltransferase [Candidatus Pacearchaeota archaeon]
MKFSVIVPSYNSARTLPGCLKALLKQNIPKNDYEIIVVDDGSTDNTKSIIKGFTDKNKNLRYIYQKNKGPAAARNLGARKSRGAILLFTDSDCIPERSWISEMVKPFRNPKIVGVAGAYGKNLEKSVISRFIAYEIEDRYKKLKEEREIDFIGTYAAAYRKREFLKTGGFDESFSTASGEDPALSFEMEKYGKLVFQPSARVGHHHPNTLKKLLKQKYKTGYWRVALYRKYPKKIFKHSYTPKIFYLELALLGVTCLLLLLSLIFWNKTLAYITLTSFILTFLLTLPYSFKVKGDASVALLSPFIILIRNFVMGCGVVIGFFRRF